MTKFYGISFKEGSLLVGSDFFLSFDFECVTYY